MRRFWKHLDEVGSEGQGLTLDIVLQDFGEDGEERFLEAADGGGVGLAGDADGQTQRLKQVVVEVRFAGILKKEQNYSSSYSSSKSLFKKKTKQKSELSL